MTAYQEIIDFLKPQEEIEAIVFGEDTRRKSWHRSDEDIIPSYVKGKIISFEEAKEFLLDWQIAGGYGGQEVLHFYAWTNFRIIFIGTYDGATWIEAIPRNPSECLPCSVGG
jgi:hypothetical protein